MGRGANSKGLRKTRRQMARGKIHGTTLTENGQRVTPRDIKNRRELNKTIALGGSTLTLQEFEEKRASWTSGTDAQRKAEFSRAMEKMAEAHRQQQED